MTFFAAMDEPPNYKEPPSYEELEHRTEESDFIYKSKISSNPSHTMEPVDQRLNDSAKNDDCCGCWTACVKIGQTISTWITSTCSTIYTKAERAFIKVFGDPTRFTA